MDSLAEKIAKEINTQGYAFAGGFDDIELVLKLAEKFQQDISLATSQLHKKI